MDDRDKTMLSEFKRRISLENEKHVKRIIVFGSRIRGKATEDSDLDVVVLIDERNPEVIKSFEDIAYSVMWDHDFKPIISLKVFVESEFNNAANRGFSFYRNVLKEGISV